MAFTKFRFKPGLSKDESPLASEGGWVDADKVRFRQGQAEVIGGWSSVTQETFDGVARGAHAWTDLNGIRYAAWGTNNKLYALIGSSIRDITPSHSEGVLTNAVSTQNGLPVVTIAAPGHGLRTGMIVTFSNMATNATGIVLSGNYTISVIDEDTYTVTHSSPATATVSAGGGNVDYVIAFSVGRVDGTGEPGGYGTDAYGEGGYGAGFADKSSILTTFPRIWFLSNWGETLLAVPRGGGLYQYQPSPEYPNLVSNPDLSTAVGWTLGTGWTVSGGVANAAAGTASTFSTPVTVIPGYTYRVNVTVTRTAGSVRIMGTGSMNLGEASHSMSAPGTYSRLFYAKDGMTSLEFVKTNTFAGSIDNVSLTLESKAYRVKEAPPVNAGMFVDMHQIVVLFGTTIHGGSYVPMAVRWCDAKNLREWTPSLSNLSGDDILALGGRLVAGIATRQQNLIWSDTALYTMLYSGEADIPFTFELAGTGCGALGGLAVAEHNSIVYWAAKGSFYAYTGAAPAPIECTIERDVFENIAENQAEKIVCGVLPGKSEVWFLYPDKRDGAECSRYAAFSWMESAWTAGAFNRSAYIRPGIYEYPIMFSNDGKIYFHEFGKTADGGQLEWFIESGYFDVGDGEQLMMIRRIVGDFDDLEGYVDFTLYGKLWPTSEETKHGPFRHMASTTKLDFRATARQMKVRLSASASPTFARLGAFGLDVLTLGSTR